ncbi:MAG: ribonuclease Z [Candidatus Brocadiaceae bacterium]
MELTIIGSGTGMPSQTRAYPCTLVKIKDKHLVFDTGPGSLRQLFLSNVTCLDIDYLYYSHFHMDHSLDLVSILFAMRYHVPKRTRPLYITGPTGLRAFYEGLLAVYKDGIAPKTFDVHLKEIDRGEMVYEDWKIAIEPLKHFTMSIGFRIESQNGKTLTYSGDTDYCDGILCLSKKVNTLILECSFPDEQRIEGHLTPRLCAQIAHESQCDRLILTHIYPNCDAVIKNNNHHLIAELKNIYHGEIVVASDFSRFTV